MKQLLFTADVTRSAPSFHNPGHIRMWYDSPLRDFNPHIMLIVFVAIITAGIYYYFYFKRKHSLTTKKDELDQHEQEFRKLVTKKQIIMNKILDLEESFKAGKLTEDKFRLQEKDYKDLLLEVKLALKKYMD